MTTTKGTATKATAAKAKATKAKQPAASARAKRVAERNVPTPPAADFAGVSIAGRQRATEDEIVAWITAQLADAGEDVPTAGRLLKQWRAEGRAANEQRFGRLYASATG